MTNLERDVTDHLVMSWSANSLRVICNSVDQCYDSVIKYTSCTYPQPFYQYDVQYLQQNLSKLHGTTCTIIDLSIKGKHYSLCDKPHGLL